VLTTSTIFQGPDQNILKDAAITATVAPRASYDLAVLGYERPDWFVAFDTDTVTVRFTRTDGSPPSAAQGDILVIPNCNLVTGTTTLVASGGLSQALTFADVLRNGLRKTLAVDLSILDPLDGDRLGSWWELQIVGNPENVILGGGISIYSPKTQLIDRDVRWGYSRNRRGLTIGPPPNQYGVEAVMRAGYIRGCELSLLATDQDADAIEGWCESLSGHADTGLLWVVDFEDPYYGRWQQPFRRIIGSESVPDTEVITLPFEELAKGLAL